MPIQRVRTFVKWFDSSLEPIEFTESTKTVQEAADALGVQPGQIAKSILLTADSGYGLFVMAGDVRVDSKKVKPILGRKPKMADPEEVERVTGYKVGGVCPFNLAVEVPIFLDESMKRFDVVYTAAGTANSALPITFEQLQTITGGTVVNAAKK
jgi:Cys-tRNA(Pro) deacylase